MWMWLVFENMESSITDTWSSQGEEGFGTERIEKVGMLGYDAFPKHKVLNTKGWCRLRPESNQITQFKFQITGLTYNIYFEQESETINSVSISSRNF